MPGDHTPLPDTTPLATALASLHEMFIEAVRQGFTEDQAVKLVVAIARRNGSR